MFQHSRDSRWGTNSMKTKPKKMLAISAIVVGAALLQLTMCSVVTNSVAVVVPVPSRSTAAPSQIPIPIPTRATSTHTWDPWTPEPTRTRKKTPNPKKTFKVPESKKTYAPAPKKTKTPKPAKTKKPLRVHPGGWCHVPGVTGVASNGRSYTCRGGHWRK